MECPYCQTPLEEEDNFCPSCYKQGRCLECEKALKADAPRCLACGTATKDSQVTGVPAVMNTYRLSEKVTETTAEREIIVSVSDRAIESGTDFLRGGGMRLPLNGGQLAIPRKDSGEPVALIPLEAESTEEYQYTQTEQEPLHAHSPATPDTPRSEAEHYFNRNGDYLEAAADSLDYGGLTKKDQQVRFLLMYLWAYPLIFEQSVPDREHLYEAARKNGAWSTHLSTYLSNAADKYLNSDGPGLSLKPGGKAQIKKIRKDMASGVNGYAYWASGSSATGPKGHSPSGKDKELVAAWKDIPSPLAGPGINIRGLKTAWQWAALAVCDIVHVLKVTDGVKPGTAYHYLTERYPGVNVTSKQFRNAMASDVKRFRKLPGSRYRLEESAEQEIRSTVQLPTKSESASGRGSEKEDNLFSKSEPGGA